jgi:hypothetical protein
MADSVTGLTRKNGIVAEYKDKGSHNESIDPPAGVGKTK